MGNALQVTVLADSAISFSAGYRKANDLGNRAHLSLTDCLHLQLPALAAACAPEPGQHLPPAAAAAAILRPMQRFALACAQNND